MKQWDFLSFLETQDLEPDKKQKIAESHTNKEVMKYLHAFWLIEIWFWSPLALMALFQGRDIWSFLPHRGLNLETLLILSITLTSLRWTVAYTVSRCLEIRDPLQYAGLQVIPFMWRCAPGIRLPEHKEYIWIYFRYIRARILTLLWWKK